MTSRRELLQLFNTLLCEVRQRFYLRKSEQKVNHSCVWVSVWFVVVIFMHIENEVTVFVLVTCGVFYMHLNYVYFGKMLGNNGIMKVKLDFVVTPD